MKLLPARSGPPNARPFTRVGRVHFARSLCWFKDSLTPSHTETDVDSVLLLSHFNTVEDADYWKRWHREPEDAVASYLLEWHDPHIYEEDIEWVQDRAGCPST